MKRLRVLIAVSMLAVPPLSGHPAYAADNDVAATIETYQAVAKDPARLQTFCEMIAYAARHDDVTEEAMDAYLDKLGDEFRDAWTSEDVAEADPAESDRIDEAIGNLYVACGG